MIFISSSSTSDSARDAQARFLEERLLLERLEVEILRQRVDQVLVGHRRRHARIARLLDRRGPSIDSSFDRWCRIAVRSPASSAVSRSGSTTARPIAERRGPPR